jgi:hypothetical protein
MLEEAMTLIDTTQVQKLAARGLAPDVIADFLGVPRDQFKAVLADDPAVESAWRRGRANLQAKAMEWLVLSARRGSVQAQIYLADHVVATKDAAGDDPTDKARQIRDALRAMVAVEYDQPPPSSSPDGA